MITKLKQLWQEAFADEPTFIEDFFRTGFSPERCNYLLQDGDVAAALYWFDVFYDQQRLAYIYAVATKKALRGHGLCRLLMENTHQQLKASGYAGAILVPGQYDLFTLYEKLGYTTCSHVREFTCGASEACQYRTLHGWEYAQLRRGFLPAGAVVQQGTCLDFLECFCSFWAGEDWLLCGSVHQGVLHVQEYLGPEEKAPQITAALGAEKAHFRMPGTDRPFAMYYPLSDFPAPNYFGFAMD